jgi:Ger(x)C family germination protein
MISYLKLILVCFSLIILSGCWDRLELEKRTISLIYGFDLSEDNKLRVYQVSPLFNQDVAKKYEVYESQVNTARQAKEVFNSSGSGLVSTGKVQMILLSERLLKQEGAMPFLDVWYRDPKDTGNMRIVAVKGAISSIVNNNFEDKPMLPEYLDNVIEVNKYYNHTAFTTFHEFHMQTFDRAITPIISEIKKGENDIKVTGSALLTSRGKYKMSLNRRESALLLMLQKEANFPVSLTIHVPGSVPFKQQSTLENKKGENFITVNVFGIDRDILTRYDKGHFIFDIKMKLNISIAERTFNMNIKKDKEKISAAITKQLSKDLNSLIQRVQQKKLDPFGFGSYARAFQYSQWKKIENDWPDEFSRAEVKLTPTVKIIENGAIK